MYACMCTFMLLPPRLNSFIHFNLACMQVVVLLDSISHFEGSAVPDPGEGFVRMELKQSGIVLTPAVVNGGGTHTHLQMLCKVDPKLPVVPTWMINYVVRYLTFMMLEKVRSEIAELRTKDIYRQRIATKTDFYGFVRRRLEEISLPLHHAPSIADALKEADAPKE